MIDYHNACIYSRDRQRYLLREAEIQRLLKGRRASRTFLRRFIMVTGDLLIATGMRLKAAYPAEGITEFTQVVGRQTVPTGRIDHG